MHPLTTYFWMNSYLAEILFSFYIITSNGGDLHTFPAFLNSQQERMSQEKPEKQTNSNQPKQISTQQSNVNQPRHNRVQQPRQKETIFIKFYQLTFLPNLAPHFSQSCGFSFLQQRMSTNIFKKQLSLCQFFVFHIFN